jgi:hypothetical protein
MPTRRLGSVAQYSASQVDALVVEHLETDLRVAPAFLADPTGGGVVVLATREREGHDPGAPLDGPRLAGRDDQILGGRAETIGHSSDEPR